MMNKKGDILDMPILLITAFILAIGFFLLAFIIPSITTGLSQAGLNSTAEGTSAISQLSNFGTVTIQRGFFFLFIGMCLAVLISSIFIRSHPIFLFLYILSLGVTILVAVYMHNAYITLTSNAQLAATLASQTYINMVFEHIVKILVAVGALSMIIIFAKFSPFGGGVDNGT